MVMGLGNVIVKIIAIIMAYGSTFYDHGLSSSCFIKP